jgi:hypothetical protein
MNLDLSQAEPGKGDRFIPVECRNEEGRSAIHKLWVMTLWFLIELLQLSLAPDAACKLVKIGDSIEDRLATTM